eukprot:1556149-Rhodomonas_salina.2
MVWIRCVCFVLGCCQLRAAPAAPRVRCRVCVLPWCSPHPVSRAAHPVSRAALTPHVWACAGVCVCGAGMARV